jgi:hypothetical protein
VHGFCNVLDLLRPKVGKGQRQSFSNLPVGVTGDAHPSRFGQPLQPGRDVDAIAQEITTSDHHVADMDPNPEAQGTFWDHTRVQISQGLLDLDRALNGVHSAGELGQDAIASGIGDFAPMLGNKPVHHLAAGG